jgi:transposase
MPRSPKNYTEEQRKDVIRLHESGLKQGEIATELKRPLSFVQYTLAKYKKTGQVSELKRTGRPRSTSGTLDRRIVRLCNKKPTETASDIAAELGVICSRVFLLLGLTVSHQTIRRRLHAQGLKSRSAAKVPLLSYINRLRRKLWCRRWKAMDFSKVLHHIALFCPAGAVYG